MLFIHRSLVRRSCFPTLNEVSLVAMFGSHEAGILWFLCFEDEEKGEHRKKGNKDLDVSLNGF